MKIWIGVYIIICTIYSIYWFSKDKNQGLYRLTLTLFMPIFGFIYLIILDSKKVYRLKEPDYNYESVLFTGNDLDIRYLNEIDLEDEVNVVPVEEALLLNNDVIKRKLVIDILKGDSLKFIKVLKKALFDVDTETSHYAAVAITEIKRKLTNLIRDYEKNYEEIRSDIVKLEEFGYLVEKFLELPFLDSKLLIRFKEELANILADMVNLKPNEDVIIKKINADLDIKNYKSAKLYCQRLLKDDENVEKFYLALLKYYFVKKDYQEFNGLVKNLKNSWIKYNQQVSAVVGFW